MSLSLLHCTAMAVRSSTTGLPLPNFTTATPIPRRKKPLRLISSISAPTPRKLTSRKNYLRQKLLKTLSKPHPNSLSLELPQTNPETSIQLEQEQALNEQFSEDSCPASIGGELEGPEMQELREAEVQESVEVMDDGIGKVSKDLIFKYGLWLVGGFLLQTVCAVWVLGSAKFEDKNEVLEVDVEQKDKTKVKFVLHSKMGLENGGVVYVDEDEMEKEIEEIQVMAREARARERLERKKNGFESTDSDKEGENEFGMSGIEKEVNDRLVKVRKRYEYTRETLPVGSVNYVKKNGISEKNSLEGQGSMDHVKKHGLNEKSLGGKDGKDALMFKKKYRFRGLSSKPSDKPKGFTGLAGHGVGKEVTSSKGGGSEVLINGGIGGDVVDLLGDIREVDLQAGDSRAGIAMHLEEHGERKQALEAPTSRRTAGKKFTKEKNKRKQDEKVGSVQSKSKEKNKRKQDEKVGSVQSKSNGLTQDRNQGNPLREAVVSRKSNILKKTALSNEHDMLNTNDTLKSRGTENNQSASEIRQSETDFWWLSLPYVLVILMRRRHYGDGVDQGLFTLRSSPCANNDLSHTVAFEDRGDATNFCYLVQSFFEDLEDFSAEIIPLSIKELREQVKSQTLRVVVVKRGQLKLYAGQPLTDVEMALRSLVGQS